MGCDVVARGAGKCWSGWWVVVGGGGGVLTRLVCAISSPGSGGVVLVVSGASGLVAGSARPGGSV